MKRLIGWLVLGFFLLSACGRSTKEIENEYPTDPHYITPIYEPAILFNYLPIYVNGERTIVPYYAINGRNYFRIDDIAYLLRNTLARFTFSYRVHLTLGSNINLNKMPYGYERAGERPPSAEGEFYRTEVRMLPHVSTVDGGTALRHPVTLLDTYVRAYRPYFTLESMAGLLGFTVTHSPGGHIQIDTREGVISEYSRHAVAAFLASPANALAHSFLLYDINQNGIPVIFINWSTHYTVHMYFGGTFRNVASTNVIHEILRHDDGRIFITCTSVGNSLQSPFALMRELIITEDSATLVYRQLPNRQYLTTIRPLEQDLTQEIINAANEIRATPANAAPIIAQLLVNNSPATLAGYRINGRNYFTLCSIAYLLQNTRARFGFDEERWGAYHTSIRFNRRSAPAVYAAPHNHGALFPIHASFGIDRILGSTHGDWFGWQTTTFATEDTTFFALEDVSGALGFFLDISANGVIEINTHEPNISEYALRTAREFSAQAAVPRLMSNLLGRDYYPYDFYAYPDVVLLHDLRGLGTPDIFIGYTTPCGWPLSFIIYSYFDGAYRRIGNVSRYGEIFRDRQGRIFFLEGSHQMGFDTLRMLTFHENNFSWHNLYVSLELQGQLAIPNEHFDYALFRRFWEYWTHPTPAMLDNPGEPLTAFPFLRELTEYLR